METEGTTDRFGAQRAASEAKSFVNWFVKHGGRFSCGVCGRPVNHLPHVCKESRAR